jgi:hypothetical protein
MDTVFVLIFACGFIFVLLWLKRKLEEREATLSSGEIVTQLERFTYGTQLQLKGKIDLKEKDIWYRVLLDIETEEEIDGQRYHLPKEFNTYSLAIINDAGKTVYSEKGSLRPFMLNLQARQHTKPTGLRRKKNKIVRTGQVILLEFASKKPGKFYIQYDFQKTMEVRTEKYNFKSKIRNIDVSIKRDVVPISSKGEYHHNIVELT